VSRAHILALSCANRPGIVAAVATALFEAGHNILDARQFDDTMTGRFFMRVVFDGGAEPPRARLADIARDFAMAWTLRPADARKRVLILTSKFDHCLVDLLYRRRIGELDMELAGVVSNHPRETFSAVDLDGVAFDHLRVDPAGKSGAEASLARIVDERRVDLVVLARYMQVLSDEMAAKLAGRCVNIHHSFLPGFKGAKPYHQAHARGVKLIGATAHFVTPELDEGPIIEQDVERITHRDTPDDLVRKGRDIERRVLARAVRLLLEDRALLNGSNVVVFDD
jgi:formyltetrahydrofolate deformylase